MGKDGTSQSGWMFATQLSLMCANFEYVTYQKRKRCKLVIQKYLCGIVENQLNDKNQETGFHLNRTYFPSLPLVQMIR